MTRKIVVKKIFCYSWDVRIIDNVEEERELIESSISKFGYSPDHNFDWLKSCSNDGSPAFVVWKDGEGVWFYVNKKTNQHVIVADPIAPTNVQDKILKELCDYVLGQSMTIYFLDVRESVQDFAIKNYRDKFKPDYEIVWPVVDMATWNPELPGSHFKELRNALSKFNREHAVKISETSELSKKDLHDIVDRWFASRARVGIAVLPERYHDMIDNNFGGTKSSRVMIVDNKPVGFNAGWETSNNPSEWSASIGIHDYSIKDLGVALLYEDLVWIKNAGYKSCDLEGSDSQALRFKTQFFNKFETYKTYTFYIK
ncbi:MAG TPA: hypothetical protein DCS06_03280 [Candidatus Yanofskybacteria bacterium]|nr:hypothetical protein [Candidatus Yanofskybacteria bacterium]HBX58487.1 hypothetical protein [Candidatus Yanofskybacteria bacterium]